MALLLERCGREARQALLLSKGKEQIWKVNEANQGNG
jgi:hypothetical protein